MKQRSTLSRFKPSKPVTLGLLLCIFVVITAFALERLHVFNSATQQGMSEGQNSGPTKKQQAQQSATDAQNKQNYLDNATKSGSSDTSSSSNSSSNGTTSPDSGTLSVTASQNGSSVTVLTQMQNVNSGTCKLNITNGNVSAPPQTAQIIYQPQFSSCAGFSVPVTSVSKGNWEVTVTVTTGSGSVLSKTTSLEVN